MEKVLAVANRLKLDRFTNLTPIKMISSKVKVQPILVVIGIFVILVLFFTLTRIGRSLLEAAVFFAYPAIKSNFAVKTVKSTDDHQWITYWVCFSFIYSVQACLPELLDWIPVWGILRLVFLAYLIHPRPKTNEFVHLTILRPLVEKWDHWMEDLRERHSSSRDQMRRRKRRLLGGYIKKD